MYIIKHFNVNLVDEQQHMLKATQVAEGIIYPYFIKFGMKNDVFPVPLLGVEFANQWVKLDGYKDDDDELYTLARFSKILLNKEDMVDMHSIKDIQNELNNLRIQKLSSSKEKDLLHLIDTITLATDPCDTCQWSKTCSKKTKISCTGVTELCRLKSYFFKEWPEEMMTHAETAFLLADCNTMKKYADILNMIFSVRFVERVLELKALVDTQIFHMYPHLSLVIWW